MTPNPRDARSRAEAKFKSRQTTNREARQRVDAELQATCKKTAKLKAQRLSKEVSEGISDLDKKPKAKR